MNTFNLSLDLDKRGGVAQWVTLRQGDHNGTELRATIYDHGTQAGGGYTCRVSIRLPGAGDEYYRETATYTNGVAVVTVDEEYAAAIVGVTEGYFELLQGDPVIASTESFGVRILRSAQDGAVPGDKYDSAIEDALAELDEATGRISQMVVDATEEYLEAHPELTTTVEDNSLTDAKLVQHGGILDRVARLWYRLDNLLTSTPAESDALTVSDAAKTPLAGLALYGRSTQSGTPTPSAPVAIESVVPQLFEVTASTQTINGVTFTPQADGTVRVNGTATSSAFYTAGTVTLPAGTYVLAGYADGALVTATTHYRIYVNGSGVTANSGTPFTATQSATLTVYVQAISGQTFNAETLGIALWQGSEPLPFVPYGCAGLWAKRTSDATQQSVTPIDIQGHTLRSLPDGTRDEVTVDQYGHAILIQRVGSYTVTGNESVTPTSLGDGWYRVVPNVLGSAPSVNGSTAQQGYCSHAPFSWTPTVKSQHAGTQGTFVLLVAQESTGAAILALYAGAEINYALATPVTIDLGTIDPVALQGPYMTAQSVPTAPFQLTYERDLNTTLDRLEAAIAEVATS